MLNILPTLDFQAVVNASGEKANETADALLRLAQLHIVEHSGDEFSVSPPLRIAVERDKRVSLPEAKRKQVLAKLADSLAVRLDEGTAPITLVDSAVLGNRVGQGNVRGSVSSPVPPRVSGEAAV